MGIHSAVVEDDATFQRLFDPPDDATRLLDSTHYNLRMLGWSYAQGNLDSACRGLVRLGVQRAAEPHVVAGQVAFARAVATTCLGDRPEAQARLLGVAAQVEEALRAWWCARLGYPEAGCAT